VGRLRITETVPLGPVDITRQVKVGDYLLGVDGTKISADTNLDDILAHSVNRRTKLSVSSSATGVDPKTLVVRPVNQATEKNLLYREWVEWNRAYVEKVSQGRLGYAHMNDMSCVGVQFGTATS
jgi:C-terminal processing protease CtpA/Prc